MIPYGSLSPDQLAQVEARFADRLFGTDPAAYSYEANERGEITGRSCGQQAPMSRRRSASSGALGVHTLIVTAPTEEERRRSAWLLDHLADKLIERVSESTPALLQRE